MNKKHKSSQYDTHLSVFVGDVFRGLRAHWRAMVDSYAKKFDLTRSEWHVLGFLHCRGSGLTQHELAKLLEINTAQLTRILTKLEERNILAKALDKKDRRIKHLILQPAAEPYLAVMTQISEQLNNIILAELSAQEEKLVKSLLGRAKQALLITPLATSKVPARTTSKMKITRVGR